MAAPRFAVFEAWARRCRHQETFLTASSWAGSFGFAYDALGRRTSLTRPNGVNTSYSYDSVSHLLAP